MVRVSRGLLGHANLMCGSQWGGMMQTYNKAHPHAAARNPPPECWAGDYIGAL